jgi:hypothetical protein
MVHRTTGGRGARMDGKDVCREERDERKVRLQAMMAEDAGVIAMSNSFIHHSPSLLYSLYPLAPSIRVQRAKDETRVAAGGGARSRRVESYTRRSMRSFSFPGTARPVPAAWSSPPPAWPLAPCRGTRTSWYSWSTLARSPSGSSPDRCSGPHRSSRSCSRSRDSVRRPGSEDRTSASRRRCDRRAESAATERGARERIRNSRSEGGIRCRRMRMLVHARRTFCGPMMVPFQLLSWLS